MVHSHLLTIENFLNFAPPNIIDKLQKQLPALGHLVPHTFECSASYANLPIDAVKMHTQKINDHGTLFAHFGSNVT